MCGVEVINLKSSNCTWVGTSDHHVWQKYTYTLCPTGARRRGPCDDVQRAEGQTYNDDGSIRMNACPVCAKLAVAVRERNEAKRLADERYATAYGAAFTDERYIYPPPSPPESSGHRESREGRREDQDSERRRRDRGRGKHHDRARESHHEERGSRYHS